MAWRNHQLRDAGFHIFNFDENELVNRKLWMGANFIAGSLSWYNLELSTYQLCETLPGVTTTGPTLPVYSELHSRPTGSLNVRMNGHCIV